MKKMISLILSAALLLLSAGCGEAPEHDSLSMKFYYLTSSVVYNRENGVLDCEKRQTGHLRADIPALLNIYFQGPEDENLTNPFPAQVSVSNLITTGDSLYILLSENFSRLTGISLTLACSCVAKTVFENFPEFRIVKIAAEHTMLEGSKVIILSRDDILFQDHTVVSEKPVETSLP